METITMKQAKRELKHLEKVFTKNGWKGKNRQAWERYIRARGYEECQLGCGNTLYICSGEIKILLYRNSPILAIGLANKMRCGYVVYNAYIKSIVE